MIVSMGIEWVDADRFERAVARFGDRLLDRLFSQAEQEEAGQGRRRFERLAARFAAKVALRRAFFGSPLAGAIGWRDVEVRRSASGAPRLLLRGAAKARADALCVVEAHLSMSHDSPAALAHVLLEAADG